MQFIIPADYCISICDFAKYRSFVSSDWELEQLTSHFVREMANRHILVWGTGAPANWRVEVLFQPSGIANSHREIVGGIEASGDKLYLASYDSLTEAAQYEDVKLPDEECQSFCIDVAPALYNLRIIQLYNPEEAESEAVFYQEGPHFVIEMTRSQALVDSWRSVPWFPY